MIDPEGRKWKKKNGVHVKMKKQESDSYLVGARLIY